MTTENEKYKASLLQYLKRKKEHPYHYSRECQRHYSAYPVGGEYSGIVEDAAIAVLKLEGKI